MALVWTPAVLPGLSSSAASAVPSGLSDPLQTIAAYLCVSLGRLDKVQGKAVTHFCEVEWWRTLMVECVTAF